LNMAAEIKPINSTDLQEVNRLLRVAKGQYGYDQDYLNRFMDKFGITEDRLKKGLKGVYVDDQIAGFYGFVQLQDGTLELDNFYVAPEHAGKGIGRQLWNACTKDATQYKTDEFIVWSDPSAEGFYVEMGCEKIGVRPSPMAPNRTPPVMKYTIKA